MITALRIELKKHKPETDLELLYAWTNAEEVRRYCATHELSNLSRREALKNIGLS
jgi:hypothetical protein